MKILKKLEGLITKPKKGIFEINREKKLLNKWNYYILKYDFSNVQNPFIAIERTGDKLISQTNLNLTEIRSEKYNNFLKLSNSEKIIKEYYLNKTETIKKWYLESKSLDKFNGDWISEDIFRFIDDTNYSNWVPFRHSDGNFKLRIDIEEEKCDIGIPVEYDDTGKGYMTFYSGRFELAHNHILIWQNEGCPVKISYKWKDKKLILDNPKLLGTFVKE
ncbi:hypothetical protein [Tenacibaculum sp. nBUS_03]|uniref:hypothetical protein n=1 Tax=Tenacibaculum sp. nBUS_03 TaxID=3395320 RepID=UPI003EB8FAFF